MTWEGLTDGLDAHLYTPDTSVFKLSRSEVSSTRDPTARVSVLPFYLKTEEDPASETL
jgi:hypothetical protein